MAIESKSLLVAVKAFSRANPLPIDASIIWESKAEAEAYAKQANAYGGQIISVKVDGKYKGFVLQGQPGSYTLEPVGADASAMKQYVQVGTRPESNQEQGVIYIEGTTGYIWNGSEWKKVFEDLSTSIADFQKRIGKLETDIAAKANLANPEFTGTIKVNGKELATKEYADSIVAAAKSEVPIVVDTDHPFPSTEYKAGQKYVIALAGTYMGQKCEVGDLILIVKDYNADSAADSDGLVLQANINGAVTGADSSIDGEIVVFSGATGKVIKSSNINMTQLSDAVSKAHEHANKDKLDTFTKTQDELLNEAATTAQGKVDALKETVNGKADKATTLEGYGITDAYTKAEIDGKLGTITNNLNSKVDASTVDSKISASEEKITAAYGTAIDEKIKAKVGEIPDETTLKDYIDTAVGSGGTASAEAIAKAKDEAIKASKAYTDEALTITEF